MSLHTRGEGRGRVKSIIKCHMGEGGGLKSAKKCQRLLKTLFYDSLMWLKCLIVYQFSIPRNKDLDSWLGGENEGVNFSRDFIEVDVNIRPNKKIAFVKLTNSMIFLGKFGRWKIWALAVPKLVLPNFGKFIKDNLIANYKRYLDGPSG